MNREFGYNWSELMVLLWVIPATMAFIVWRHGEPSVSEVVIFVIVFLVMAVRQASSLCSVLVTGSEIYVTSLLPFRPRGQFQHDQIESYAELVIKIRGHRTPIGGVLQPKGQKCLTLFGGGIRNFKDLNAALLEMYPGPSETTEPNGE